MPLIDDRGRVFGRVNLIDALIGVFAVLLVPLGYATALLFRVPAPKITSILPTQVAAHSTVTLRVAGEDFQPFLQARIGPVDAPFLVESPTVGEIKMPDLDAGTYDVALYDQGRELVRMPAALTVVAPVVAPPPPALSPQPIARIELQAVGSFVGLASTAAQRIRLGAKFQTGDDPRRSGERPVAEVLAVGTPEPWIRRVRLSSRAFATWQNPGEQRLPAIIRLTCAIMVVDDYCRFGEVPLAPGATITLPSSLPGSEDVPAASTPNQVKFLIDEVRSVSTPPIFP